MWLSMKLPALVAGYLQQWLGYTGFFTLVMVSCLGTFLAAAIARSKILPETNFNPINQNTKKL
jgi:PAT family beta-lactamase induction signal transducer AmpG